MSCYDKENLPSKVYKNLKRRRKQVQDDCGGDISINHKYISSNTLMRTELQAISWFLFVKITNNPNILSNPRLFFSIIQEEWYIATEGEELIEDSEFEYFFRSWIRSSADYSHASYVETRQINEKDFVKA